MNSGMKIHKANQVWATDITYIRLKRGFVYLVAIIDWYSKKILSWELLTTLEQDLYISEDCKPLGGTGDS